MDNPRSTSGAGEENIGIPDDLRCKRSDGKQWRCTAMSMPDKTVCEKHYIQAKKRAANSALRASMKKSKKKTPVYMESINDDMDSPIIKQKTGDYTGSVSGKKYKEKSAKSQSNYLSETTPLRSIPVRNTQKFSDDLQRDGPEYEESHRSYRTPPSATIESSKSRSQKMFDSSPMMENSSGSSDSSDNIGGQPCHQCRQNHHGVIWCLRCDKRGYCDSCISAWYSELPLEEIQKACPACRGTCCCKVCLRGDNLLKVRIREIPAQDKLQYLYSLLSAVLPVVRRIHQEQCFEVELEKKIRGNEIDLARTKLNADEQMCCNFCRAPIIDYHRHCPNCSYDLCLSCCKDIREASGVSRGETRNPIANRNGDKGTMSELVKSSDVLSNLSKKYSGWKANSDGSIPCPPGEYEGCGCAILTLKRIFKMNWVAKLVKNVEEMVSGCKVRDSGNPEKTGFDLKLFQAAHREVDNDNFLYRPSSEDIKKEGVGDFRYHWSRGEPVIVKNVSDISSMEIWDPFAIWRGIREITEEKMKDDKTTVKAIDCFDWTEIDIELGQLIQGYSEGRIRENGWPQMLKSKNWPCPSATEEFLLYQRPHFINKLPLLEFIHSKWGLLNVAAKLPHYSLQNDVGPKIFISYGTYEEMGRGDSINNLHLNMRDMVFLLVHVCDMKMEDWQKTNIGKIQKSSGEAGAEELSSEGETEVDAEKSYQLSPDGLDKLDKYGDNLVPQGNGMVVDEKTENTCMHNQKDVKSEDLDGNNASTLSNCPGTTWDVFRREDVPKLIQYISIHWKEIENSNSSFPRVLYDGVTFLNRHHKSKLKEEFGVEPWSFEQHLGEAVFIPAGCPFQIRHLQSNVQLGLDFLSPESLSEAVRLAEEIRGLPNDHDTKLQMLEVGKISLYAASSAVKEVQKLVLDPKLGPELGFEDPNLTAAVSENLEKMIKRRHVTCV